MTTSKCSQGCILKLVFVPSPKRDQEAYFLSQTLQFVPVHINYVSLGVMAAGGAEKSYTNQEEGRWSAGHSSYLKDRRAES